MSDSSSKLKLHGAMAQFAEEVGYTPSKIDQALEAFITVDKETLRIKDKVRLLAARECSLPVLILGETGVGKELIARALHAARTGKFIDVNCAGLPDTLLEAEFFGATPGAYTGAILRQGFLEEAAGGTLFLDEIGDMPTLLQSKLLRALQEKKARRLGSAQSYDVTCRVVSATNKELIGADQHFRQDLYHRLAGCVLKLKPLRLRLDDIEPIVRSKVKDEGAIIEITAKFIEMECYGNVRGLMNFIEDWKIEQQLNHKKG